MHVPRTLFDIHSSLIVFLNFHFMLLEEFLPSHDHLFELKSSFEHIFPFLTTTHSIRLRCLIDFENSGAISIGHDLLGLHREIDEQVVGIHDSFGIWMNPTEYLISHFNNVWTFDWRAFLHLCIKILIICSLKLEKNSSWIPGNRHFLPKN